MALLLCVILPMRRKMLLGIIQRKRLINGDMIRDIKIMPEKYQK